MGGGGGEVVREGSSPSLPAALVCKLLEAFPSAQRETRREDSFDQTGISFITLRDDHPRIHSKAHHDLYSPNTIHVIDSGQDGGKT